MTEFWSQFKAVLIISGAVISISQIFVSRPGSSVGIATELPGWTVRGSNPGGGEIFRTRPDRPWGPSSLLYNGNRVFPGGGG